MNLTSNPVALGPGAFISSSTQAHPCGTAGVDRFGRLYRYVKAGASALVAGNVIQSPAQVANHITRTPVAAAVGAVQVVAALGATAAAEDLYKEGSLIIDTTPGNGYRYVIEQHAAVSSSGNITVNLAKDTPIQVALTTSSRVSFLQNPYRGVIQSPVTTLTGAVVGVAVYPITAAEYGWIGVNGDFPTLIAGTPAVGAAVVVPGTAAGCVVVDGAAAATQVVGAMLVTGADGLNLPVRWAL